MAYLECDQCGRGFEAYPSHRTKAHKYCGSTCASIAQVNRTPAVTFNCETCGAPVTRRGLQKTQRPNRFCSRQCRTVRPTDRKVSLGYWYIRLPLAERRANHLRGHRKRANRPWIAEHIAIAERALGRPLKAGEVVHHINCDRLDNRNENLLVCDRSYHSWLHGEMSRRYAAEKFGGGLSLS